ncbi:MAG: EAL domain-containing protein [Clostridiaceae bacterium]|nr:EAL domain-containing protein [Clostridiaceae bacterium]
MSKTLVKRVSLIISFVLYVVLNINTYVKAESHEKVLILHSYSEDFKWTNNISAGIKSVLGDVDKIELLSIYMDTKRVNNSVYIESFKNLCKIKYADTKFDVIICSDNDALNFLVKYGDSLFPNTPVVFCGVNNFNQSMLNRHKNYTGIVETIDIEPTIKSIIRLQPTIKDIIVVCDSTSTGKLNEEDTKDIIKRLRLDVNFHFYRDINIETLDETVKKFGDNTAVLHVGQLKNNEGEFINYENIGPLISKHIKAANYICWDFALGNGLLGGKVLNSMEHGRAAAGIALKILNGEKVENIPIVSKSVSSYTFDYIQLKNFKIDKDKLPDGSAIINKNFSFYETYKKLVWSVISILIILSTFIIILFINVKRRKESERKLQENFEELSAVYEELTATEEELRAQYDELQESEEFLRLSEERYKHLAYYDNLTSLPNKISFLDELDKAIDYSNKTGEKGAVLFIDLDNFKRVNDTLGHHYGDRLLKVVADRLETIIDKNKSLYRLGGDEFLVLMKNVENKKTIANTCKKITNSFRSHFEIDGKQLFTTVSIGISLYPNDGLDSNLILKNADTAMYRAKDLGRNRYEFYNIEMFNEILKKSQIEKGLRNAIIKNEFQLYYQPQIDCKTRKIKGMEALLRWKSNDFGFVSPAEFIPIAEETSLILPIGRWVLKTACKQAKQWLDFGYNLGAIAVNVSIVQLQHPGFINIIKNALIDSNLPPKLLEIEITESVLMQCLDYNITILNELKRLGINISLDDFGTGYSSLNYLRILPINNLKIDKSFIDSIHLNSGDKEIADGIIQLAHKMNLNVIAEGVEWENQFQILQSLNCEMVQGYLFSRPIPADHIENLSDLM